MKINMGSADRMIRAILAVVIIAFLAFSESITADSTWFWVLGVIAVLLLGTTLFRFCPMYLPFGIRTTKASDS